LNPALKLLPDFKGLSLEEQVAQMVVVQASGYLFDHQIQYPAWEPPARQLQYWLQELGIGGVILLGGSAGELALRSQQLQDWAKIPLIIGADIEEGVGQRFGGATWFPPPMAIGTVAFEDIRKALRYADQMGISTAQEALAIGINWVLAPVVNVNNNYNNPVLNIRSFGETPEAVSQLACAFIRGAKQYPVLTTAKYFPAYGDPAIASHLDLPVLSHSPSHLATVELPPFKEAIRVGVDTVISAHLLIPTWDSERPATLSRPILTELLRGAMNFEGLIVTDALVMGAIANRYGANEAPVMAVEAGADILLMPVNPEGAIRAVCDAVTAGRISHQRIQASVERIWQAKGRVSFNSGCREASSPSTSKNPNFIHQLAQPTALHTAAKILQDSQVVGGSLPLSLDPSDNHTHQLCNLIVVDDLLNCGFLGGNAPAVTIPQKLGYELQLVDCHTLKLLDQVEHPVASRATLVQLFLRGNPFRGSTGLLPVAEQWLKTLRRNNNLQALIIYGSPYVLEQLLPNLPTNTPYVFSYGQMPQSQAIALEVLFRNHSPD
jgi:beta-glucosidase